MSWSCDAVYGADRVCLVLCILCSVLMGVFWLMTRLMVRKSRKHARWDPIQQLDGKAESARLVCHGDAIELQRLCNLNEHMSEPYIAMRELPIINAQRVTVGAGAWVGGVVLGASVGAPGHFMTPALVVAVLWAYTKLCPLYYRASTGRIEVLKFPAFRSRGCVAACIDLTRARVICRYDQRGLSVTEQNDKGRTIAIGLWALSALHEFAEAVFRGRVRGASGVASPLAAAFRSGSRLHLRNWKRGRSYQYRGCRFNQIRAPETA